MKHYSSRPVILPISTTTSACHEAVTVPFPVRPRIVRLESRRGFSLRPADDLGSESALAQMRGRLLKMILANEWDRTHGHRAS